MYYMIESTKTPTESTGPISVAKFGQKIMEVRTRVEQLPAIYGKFIELESFWSSREFKQGCQAFKLSEIGACLEDLVNVTSQVAVIANNMDGVKKARCTLQLGTLVLNFGEQIQGDGFRDLKFKCMFAAKLLNPKVFEINEEINNANKQLVEQGVSVQEGWRQLELQLQKHVREMKEGYVDKCLTILRLISRRGELELQKNKDWCNNEPNGDDLCSPFEKYTQYLQMYVIFLCVQKKGNELGKLSWDHFLTGVVIYGLWRNTDPENFAVLCPKWPLWGKSGVAAQILFMIKFAQLVDKESVDELYQKWVDLTPFNDSSPSSSNAYTEGDIRKKLMIIPLEDKIYLIAQVGMTLVESYHEKEEPCMSPIYVHIKSFEIFFTAIRNEVIIIKNKNIWEEVVIRQKHLSERFLYLSRTYFPSFHVFSREMAMIAFSLNHTMENLDYLQEDRHYEPMVIEDNDQFTFVKMSKDETIEHMFLKLKFPPPLLNMLLQIFFVLKYKGFFDCKTKDKVLEACHTLIEYDGLLAMDYQPLPGHNYYVELTKHLPSQYDEDEDSDSDDAK